MAGHLILIVLHQLCFYLVGDAFDLRCHLFSPILSFTISLSAFSFLRVAGLLTNGGGGDGGASSCLCRHLTLLRPHPRLRLRRRRHHHRRPHRQTKE